MIANTALMKDFGNFFYCSDSITHQIFFAAIMSDY